MLRHLNSVLGHVRKCSEIWHAAYPFLFASTLKILPIFQWGGTEIEFTLNYSFLRSTEMYIILHVPCMPWRCSRGEKRNGLVTITWACWTYGSQSAIPIALRTLVGSSYNCQSVNLIFHFISVHFTHDVEDTVNGSFLHHRPPSSS